MRSRNGGESANGGEHGGACTCTASCTCSAALVQWLHNAGHDGHADDLHHAAAGMAAQIAYDIADHVEAAYDGDDMPQLVWHLRTWADLHEEIT